MINRARAGAWFEAIVWRRSPNDVTYLQTNIQFKVRILTPNDVKMSQPIQGLMMQDASLIVKGYCEEITVKDQLMIMGKKYIIVGITNEWNSPYAMGGSRFNPTHLGEKVAKIIVLK